MRIRQGNDFIFLWAIERNGEPEDFSNAVNIRLHFKNYDCVGEVDSFQIIDGNIVRVEVSPEWASRLGAYRLILSYEFEDQSYSDGDRKCVVDVLAFNIVPKTSEADDVTEMAKTTDIMIGLKGDKGDPFTYDDFTPEQIEDLKRPAVEAAESVQIVENQISINEQGRVQAENEREIAETTRVSNENNRVTAEQARVESENLRATAETSRQTAESLRVEAELLRQSSTQEAISNAENAAENANTAAQNVDDAREAIQDDLALKANHGYGEGEEPKTLKEVDDEKANHGYASIEVAKTLKQVEDNAVMKLINLNPNGNFANGIVGWLFGSNISGASASSGVLSFTGGGSVSSSANNWVRRTSQITFPQGHVLYNIVTARSLMGAEFYVGIGYSFSTFDLTDQWGTYSHLGNHSTHNLPTYGAALGETVEMTNAMCFDLTGLFGAGNEPTKEEMDLLISILGIDYFEGEITIPAQKIMQWQLALIRKNKNAIIALGGTII